MSDELKPCVLVKSNVCFCDHILHVSDELKPCVLVKIETCVSVARYCMCQTN